MTIATAALKGTVRPKGPARRRSRTGSPEPVQRDLHPQSTHAEPPRRTASDLPRSASFTHVSSLSEPDAFSLTFSEEDLIPSQPAWPDDDSDNCLAAVAAPDQDPMVPSNLVYSASTDAVSKITLSRIVVAPDVSQDHGIRFSPDHQTRPPSQVGPKPRKLTRTLSGITKRNRDKVSAGAGGAIGEDLDSGSPASVSQALLNSSAAEAPVPGTTLQQSVATAPTTEENGRESSVTRRFNAISKLTSRREPSPPKNATSASSNIAPSRVLTLLPRSLSNSNLPMLSRAEQAGDVPPMPRTVSAEKLKAVVSLSPRKKDEIWSAFHALDSDFQKFQSKSSSLKANVVRSSLLPFLNAYARHPSNLNLRAEDLDRRTATLNKWWTGLLEMLSGRNGQSITGTDRPAILDGISGIMERREWRASFSNQKVEKSHQRTTSKQSRASANSDASEFLMEAVQRNVQNIFVENLLAQIVLVLDKMSHKNAPASLVAFCGKSCAYAFMFCPGVADILVRLWDIPSATLKRLLDGYGMSRTASYQETSERVSAAFPSPLQSLAFVSLTQTLQELRNHPPLPTNTDHLQWHGYWIGRWSGKDSDLFYTFVKHYHLLLVDFLPSHATQQETACAPGFLLIHTQLLTTLESTVHRQSSPSSPEPAFDPTLTFDDLLGPDATVSALPPPPPTNATRLMAENRIIMLLRDFLSDKFPGQHARHVFATTFATVLAVAVRNTSLYNHNACFTLCDFLQEAFVILTRFESTAGLDTPILDCAFWIDTFTKMVSSHNTMTEIRLYAFLYTIWGTITTHDNWKRDLCLKFLLQHDFFYSRFNHWCPMVRAYFMRLICWRIARLDAEPSSTDLIILQALTTQLGIIWSHYRHQVAEAKASQGKRLEPSTVPCSPAPGRRLLIIRTDSPTHSSFLNFINGGRPGFKGSRRQGNSLPVPVISSGPNPNQLMQKLSTAERPLDSNKKKGGLLRTLIGYRSSETRADTTSAKPSPSSSPQSSASSSRNTSPERPSSRASLYEPRNGANAAKPTNEASGGNDNANPSNVVTNNDSSPGVLGGSLGTQPSQPRSNRGASNSISNSSDSSIPYLGPAFFKFSLEFVDRRGNSANLTLHVPQLPLTAHQAVQALRRASFTASALNAIPPGISRSPPTNAGKLSSSPAPVPDTSLSTTSLSSTSQSASPQSSPPSTARESTAPRPSKSAPMHGATDVLTGSGVSPGNTLSPAPQSSTGTPTRPPLPQRIYSPSPPPCKPSPSDISASRYAGRSLAEWQLVVNECQNFFDRRRKEGVPSNRLVETPTLSVEPYRRPS